MFLQRGGYNTSPVLCPRWDTVGEDVYGSSPGMDVIADVRALQTLQRQKAQANAKRINPPLIATPGMRSQRVSLVPGDINFGTTNDVNGTIRPVFDVNFDTQYVLEDIREHQNRIRSGLYQDLFLMLQQNDRRDITATEIQAREQERMLQLGPVLERLNDELLDPLIDRCFDIMERRGLIPKPPRELQGAELKVEYVSVMAQAQRMLGITSVDRFAGFVGNLSGANPDVLDKLDMDAAVAEYGDMLGVSPKILRGDDEVQKIRQGRFQAQQQAAASEQAVQQAQAAKILSETDTRAPSALQDMVSQAESLHEATTRSNRRQPASNG